MYTKNKQQLIFLTVSFLILSVMAIFIAYFEGYENGGMRVIELISERRARVEIHIIKVGDTEIARDTIRRGAGGINVEKGKFY